MAERVAHRGPDEAGAFLSGDLRCAIGFHRLAVIDPGGSRQPMTSADGKLTVAFNGEIYNYRELRDELAAGGAVFRTQGDTEVLLHLYRRDGEAMLDRLDGMFAFAMYDEQKAQLLLARDRLGQRPLWYAVLGNRIAFGSEPVALLADGDVDARRDDEAVISYFSIGYVPAPASIWRGVRKLPPAARMVVGERVGVPETYWSALPEQEGCNGADPVERVRAEVTAAVQRRMHADVPLGALLSGGLDSAITVALMCRAAGRSGGVRTFTAGFEDGGYDERAGARAVADHVGSEHTELLVRPAPAEMLDGLVGMFGEPFADSSALPTWLICRAARQHVTVALTGDGGDEAFGGYDRYRALRLAETMGPGRYLGVKVAAALAGLVAPHDERSRLRRLVRFAGPLALPGAGQYWSYRRLFGPDELRRLLTSEFLAGLDVEAPERWFCSLYEEGQFGEEVAYAQRHDMLTYLPDDLLVKADICSMASGLELRSPFLDYRVASLGLGLPVELKVARRGKIVLREAFADLLPEQTLRGPKRGFGVPLGRWLREDLFETVRETLMDRAFLDLGVFRPEAMAGLLNDHYAGRGDHRHRLWALLVFGRWLALGG